MEENDLSFDELMELMPKIEKAMEESNQKEEEIKNSEASLKEETRLGYYEEGKAKIEEMKAQKEEFDDMTKPHLNRAKLAIDRLKEEERVDYNDKVLLITNKRQETEKKCAEKYEKKREELKGKYERMLLRAKQKQNPDDAYYIEIIAEEQYQKSLEKIAADETTEKGKIKQEIDKEEGYYKLFHEDTMKKLDECDEKITDALIKLGMPIPTATAKISKKETNTDVKTSSKEKEEEEEMEVAETKVNSEAQEEEKTEKIETEIEESDTEEEIEEQEATVEEPRDETKEAEVTIEEPEAETEEAEVTAEEPKGNNGEVEVITEEPEEQEEEKAEEEIDWDEVFKIFGSRPNPNAEKVANPQEVQATEVTTQTSPVVAESQVTEQTTGEAEDDQDLEESFVESLNQNDEKVAQTQETQGTRATTRTTTTQPVVAKPQVTEQTSSDKNQVTSKKDFDFENFPFESICVGLNGVTIKYKPEFAADNEQIEPGELIKKHDLKKRNEKNRQNKRGS